MTKNYFRVIYPPTGVCLTDTYEFAPAYRFVQKLLVMLSYDKKLLRHLNQVKLCMFSTRFSQKNLIAKPVRLLSKDLYSLISAPGHVSQEITSTCRYKYKPEYLL